MRKEASFRERKIFGYDRKIFMKNILIRSIFLILMFVLNGIQQINVFHMITLPM